MQPPQEPPQLSQIPNRSREFEQSLEDVEQLLVALKRYTQVQQDLRRQAELQQRAIQVGQERSKSSYDKIKSS